MYVTLVNDAISIDHIDYIAKTTLSIILVLSTIAQGTRQQLQKEKHYTENNLLSIPAPKQI